MDVFETASKELESMIEGETKSEDQATEIAKAIAGVLNKGKKEVRSDLSAEKVKDDKSHIEAEEDPAEDAAPSGKGYKDSSKYVNGSKKKASRDEDEDESPAPMFKKKKMKKSYEVGPEDEEEEGEAEGEVDATQFLNTLGEAVDEIRSELSEVKKALAVNLELAVEGLDNKKDELLLNMAKGMKFLIEEHKSLKKSLTEQTSLVKAVANMPGVPRAVSLFQAGGEDALKKSVSVSEAQKDTLWKARITNQITENQYKEAIKTGDLSCLSVK